MVERFKKGLEKVFLKNKETAEKGLTILMIYGSSLDKFFKMLKEEIVQVKDSAAYDMTISFGTDGKFLGAKLNDEIKMDENLSLKYNNQIEKLTLLPPNDDFNLVLGEMFEKLIKWETEIIQNLRSKKNTYIRLSSKDKLLTPQKKILRKVSFKEDIEDFLKQAKKVDILGIFDGFTLQKNKETTVGLSPTDNSKKAPKEIVSAASSSVKNMTALATNPIPFNPERPPKPIHEKSKDKSLKNATI